MNRRLFLVLLVASAITVSGCRNQVANFSASAPSKDILLKLHNKERIDRRMPLLQMDAKLTAAAQDYAEHMAKTGDFKHGNVGQRLGNGWMAYGENIAMGQSSNEEVMYDWMHSRGHRINILNSEFYYIGIGIATSPNGTIYWVVDFGSK